MKKVLAFSSIRSEYDLLSSLYKLLDDDMTIDFKLVVSGAHLSKTYGYSIKEIEKDGFEILHKTETLINSDSKASRVKSASILLLSITDIVANYDPDLIIYAGDREDVLMYAVLGGYLNIPTLHFFSGDHTTDGYIDNPIRHAISKLSTAHFVMIEQHRERLIRMGEPENRIYTVGNIALDKFVKFKPLKKNILLSNLKVETNITKFALLIFHPTTEEIDRVDHIFLHILKNLERKNIFTFVSYPNVDPGNFKLLKLIEKFRTNKNFYFFKNLNRDLFLSIYMQSEFIIGNSSSGICEAASVPIPAINVGLRQVGRYAEENVIFCDSDNNSIDKSISLALSDEFKLKMKTMINPYGQGKSALKAYKLIKTINFKSIILKKEDPLDLPYE